ncbi:uncharacterized protein LOC127079883 [Lathyrus oleraceus]|uniref:uncharacterized protein LOC127079883 n=1 Tax=Pisum sativum TaxID=3888 RepID=UPI0021D0EF6E|nr:uncharacterized protein LOC127079883 [Pisum sativum]
MTSIRHIPRLKNQVANDLAQIAFGYKISKEKLQKVIEVRGRVVPTILAPSDLEKTNLGYANKENFKILAIDNLADEDWRKPIVEYLQDPRASADRKNQTPEGVLLKYLSESEAYLALLTVHSGECGADQVGHKMKWILFRQGMYWPTMLKDCIEFAKGCQECKVHAGIQHVPTSELHSIVKPWPFRGWDLDLIGEIQPPSSKNQRYILVGVDYFTKWVEVISLPNVAQEDVIEFFQKHIIYRFGISETATTDQGSIFTGRKMQEFAKEMGFKLLKSMPYYAQANGQVEAANKRHHEIPSESYWNMMLDELVDLDEERLNSLELLKRQKKRVENSYNKKVKLKTFSPKDLVWKVVLPMDRKDRTFGKWSPKWEGPFQILQVFSNGAYEIEELSEDKNLESKWKIFETI